MKFNIIMTAITRLYTLFVVICSLSFVSCDDFLDITPTGMVMPKTGEEFRELMTNAYKSLPTDRAKTMLRSDEVQMSTDNNVRETRESYMDIWCWNDDVHDAVTVTFGWRTYYHVLYIANYIIEHQGEITRIDKDALDQLVGEAYMMRAYVHFTLINLFAQPYTHCTPATTRGIPLKLSSDVTAVLAPNTVQQVYDQVLADATLAGEKMNVEQWEKGKTYRWNKLSATCLLARASLYMGRYDDALRYSETVISQHPALQDGDDNILPNHYTSVEAIASTEKVLTNDFKSAFMVNTDFRAKYNKNEDLRYANWYRVGTLSSIIYVKKAGDGSGSVEQSDDAFRCTFRSAEFYLTAAECAIRLDDAAQAVAHLKPLVEKRYKANKVDDYINKVKAMGKDDMLTEILEERARELAFEGHRWFDLRRTTRPMLSKKYRSDTYTLEQDDPRYTLKFPPEAVAANPLLLD